MKGDRCPNCGEETLYVNHQCGQCGYTPRIGPVLDWDIFPAKAEVSSTDPDLAPCPFCGRAIGDGWNGWDCLCGYSIPEKARRMKPKTLSAEESAALRKELDIP